MTDTLTAAPVDVELLDLFDRLRDELKAEHIERDREIHGILVALVAQLHMLMLGGPGLAKSQLVDRTFLRISGATYGKWPLHRFMSVDDLFGPVDVRAYAEDGRFRRILAGYLGDVEYANLEEIFKSSASTLGMLLSSLNERVIRNDGAIHPIPLRVMICSSNELPKDEMTAPLYDRIPLRYQVEAPPDKASIQKMLDLTIRAATDIEAVLTVDQLHEAQRQARALPFAPAVSEKLTELYFTLQEKGIRPTPRRLNWTKLAMQAEAWLDGSDVVAVEHMSIAAHSLWDVPEQAGDVADSVLELANPLEKRTLRLLEDIGEIRKAVPGALACTEDVERQSRGMEIYHKLAQACDELTEITALAGTGRRQRNLLASCKTSVHEVLVTVITEVMGLSIDDATDLGLPGMP